MTRHDALLAKYGTGRNGHSLFAPSSAAGWLNCSGFLLANAKARDTAGIDAAYGTVAHHVADVWHKTGKRPAALLDTTRKAKAGGLWHTITIDAAMLGYVERYIDWCNEVPGDHYYEQRVDLTPVMPIPGQGGTADHFACEPGRLTITDLKMGTGVRVYAVDNDQARLYALGVFLEWDWIYRFETIVIRICQPRLDVFETWEISRADLIAFGDYVKVKGLAAWDENALRTPSPKACQWCSKAVVATCPARLTELDRLIDDTFDGVEEPSAVVTTAAEAFGKLAKMPERLASTAKLSTKALSRAYTMRRHVEKWFSAMGEELLKRAENGETLPFQKLVDGRSRKVWRAKMDMPYLVKGAWGIAEGKVAPPKLLSVSKLAELIRAEAKAKPAEIEKFLKPHFDRVPGPRTLAEVKDDRPDAFSLVDDIFEGEEEDDDEL